VYDDVGRVLSQVESHGRETSYEYKANGVATVTASDDAPPNVMVHDRRGRMTAMIDGLGNTMRVAYDDLDNVVKIVDRARAETRFTHDERGNITERIDPDGLSHTYEWGDADRLVADTDRAGATTRYNYEDQDRSPARVLLADEAEVHATYNELGLPLSIRDADGVSATFEWNRDGQVDGDADAGLREGQQSGPLFAAVLDDAERGRAAGMTGVYSGPRSARRSHGGQGRTSDR
jgi:YD repeat-containing protein